jgi:hypothetical protein
MVAPLLAEEGDANTEAVLAELTEETAASPAPVPAPTARAAAAGAPAPASQPPAAQPQAKPTRSAIPRWP